MTPPLPRFPGPCFLTFGTRAKLVEPPAPFKLLPLRSIKRSWIRRPRSAAQAVTISPPIGINGFTLFMAPAQARLERAEQARPQLPVEALAALWGRPQGR